MMQPKIGTRVYSTGARSAQELFCRLVLLSFLVLPVMALLLFNLNIYLWHIPALYDATLRNEGIHIVEHLTFMAFGLVTWWPVPQVVDASDLL